MTLGEISACPFNFEVQRLGKTSSGVLHFKPVVDPGFDGCDLFRGDITEVRPLGKDQRTIPLVLSARNHRDGK
jgi:hypothetical protein